MTPSAIILTPSFFRRNASSLWVSPERLRDRLPGGGQAGAVERYTQGKSVEDWKKPALIPPASSMISWEEFQEKKYFRRSHRPKWQTFLADERVLQRSGESFHTTPSGKIEFYSERLAKHFPDDERAASPEMDRKGSPP